MVCDNSQTYYQLTLSILMISFDSKIPSCNHAITLVPSLEIAVDKIDTNSSTTSNVLLARSSVVMTHFRVIGLVILAFN